MPINVTVTNSGKISPQGIIIRIFVFILVASRFNSKVYHFSLGLSRIIFNSHSSHKQLKIE